MQRPSPHRSPRARGGFTLLEVMVALAILVTSLAILAETQASAVKATAEAQRIVTATQLAQEKLAEVVFLMEEEGFTDMEISERGDFRDFGDEAMDLEFGDELEDYHFEYLVYEIDLGMAGDIADMASEYGDDQAQESGNTGATDQQAQAGLGQLGVGNDMISEYLGRYIRQVIVRVWWGDDSDEAKERGDEVVLTGHVINPTGLVRQAEQGQGLGQ